jgi:hypothetical protein
VLIVVLSLDLIDKVEQFWAISFPRSLKAKLLQGLFGLRRFNLVHRTPPKK